MVFSWTLLCAFIQVFHLLGDAVFLYGLHAGGPLLCRADFYDENSGRPVPIHDLADRRAARVHLDLLAGGRVNVAGRVAIAHVAGVWCC